MALLSPGYNERRKNYKVTMRPGSSRFSVLKAGELRDVPEECRLLILQHAIRSYVKTRGQRIVDWAFMVSVSVCGTFGLFIGFLRWGHVGAILTMAFFVFIVCGLFGVVYNVRGKILLRAYLETESGSRELRKYKNGSSPQAG
jgi:hypothetical protein